MKFAIQKEVFDKFPDLFVAIPLVYGFDNTWTEKNRSMVEELKRNSEDSLRSQIKDLEALEAHPYIQAYFNAFRAFGANPKKVKPTHFALAKRVLEGGNLPAINPIVDVYNSFSIKYITPFGGEELDKVYGDFVMKLAKGDEHWLGIGEPEPKSPKQGDLIWGDDYDVSTLSLNWRQCERTKLVETSKNGYFIMDGFKGINEDNIRSTAQEFVKYVTDNFGGKGEVIYLDSSNPVVEIAFESKSIEGVQVPKMIAKNNSNSGPKNLKSVAKFEYEQGSVESGIQAILSETLSAMGVSLNSEDIDVSVARDPKYGDYTSTVSMRIAKGLNRTPVELASELASKIPSGLIIKAEFVHPGFLNLFVNKEYIKQQLLNIDEKWGRNNTGGYRKVMIEFGQPNTHKELTMGHIKSGITGLSLTRLFEFSGYDVVKANYFGDVGLMIAKSLWGVVMKVTPEASIMTMSETNIDQVKRYLLDIKEKEGIKSIAKFFSDSYVFGNKSMEEDIKAEDQVREINKALYSKENEGINEIYKFTRDLSIQYQDFVFAELGVVYDRQYPESENMAEGLKLVRENIGKVFQEDDGAVIFNGEPYGLKKFVFISKDGVPTYSGKDLGLAFKKFQEYPDLYLSIITTSVEQVDYFKNMIKALELIDGRFEGKYKHIGFGWLLFEGKKTSARMGKAFSYEDMLQELIATSKERVKDKEAYSTEDTETIAKNVAIAALKFGILSHEFHKDVNYNPDTFLNMNGYSGPYVLYTYTRANSILEKAGEYKKEVSGSTLNSPEEQQLIKKLLEFPKIALNAQQLYASHLVCSYVFEVSNLFNNFYAKHSVLNTDSVEEKNARLVLVDAVAKTIKNALFLLGIETIGKM